MKKTIIVFCLFLLANAAHSQTKCVPSDCLGFTVDKECKDYCKNLKIKHDAADKKLAELGYDEESRKKILNELETIDYDVEKAGSHWKEKENKAANKVPE